MVTFAAPTAEVLLAGAPTAVLSGARYRKIGRLGSHGRVFGDVGVCLGGGGRFGLCILQVFNPSSSADSRLHCLSAAKWGLWVPAAVFVRLYLWFERWGATWFDQFGNGLYEHLRLWATRRLAAWFEGYFVAELTAKHDGYLFKMMVANFSIFPYYVTFAYSVMLTSCWRLNFR